MNKKKQISKKKQIQTILSDYEPHAPEEFIPITHRFSAVIAKLREEGDLIDTIPIAHNKYIYQMRRQEVRGEKAA